MLLLEYVRQSLVYVDDGNTNNNTTFVTEHENNGVLYRLHKNAWSLAKRDPTSLVYIRILESKVKCRLRTEGHASPSAAVRVVYDID